MNKKIIFLVLSAFYNFAFSQNFSWVKTLGSSSGACSGEAIVTDNNNNVYTAGYYKGNGVTIGPGSNTTTLPANGGIPNTFVLKHDSNGNLLNSYNTHTTGSSGSCIALDIAYSTNGYIYIVGEFSGPGFFNFDPSGPFSTNTNLISSGGFDLFLLKLDLNLNCIWAKKIGGSGNEQNTKIKIDNNNNLILCADFENTLDLNPGTGTFNITSNGSSDSFVLKLDTDGNFIWGNKIGGTGSDNVTDIALKTNGNVIVSGSFSNTIDIDPGLVINNISSIGLSDVYLTEYNSSDGSLNQFKNFGNISTDNSTAIAVDNNNNVFITGNYSGIIDFDFSSNTYNLNSNIDGQSFNLKLNNNFNLLWANAFKTSYSTTTTNVIFKNNIIYLSGSFGGNTDFDPSNNVYNLNGLYSEPFIVKLNTSGQFISANQLVCQSAYNSCNNMCLDNLNNIYITNFAKGNVDVDPGINSNIINGGMSNFVAYTVKLSNQCNSTSSTINPSTCSSYTAPDGQVYTQTGNYTATIQNSLGCDSVITINLTVSNSSASSITETACKEYQAPDGQVYTQSGTYISIIPNSNGCDSTITINLTINTLVTSIVQNGASLNCTTNNAQYQWINCSTNQPINGATSQNYNPTSNGAYSVIATTTGCSDTSNCFELTNLSINELIANSFTISPNPTAGDFTITGLELYNNISSMCITDVNGKLVKELDPLSTKFSIETLKAGVYFLTISNGNKNEVIKLIKE